MSHINENLLELCVKGDEVWEQIILEYDIDEELPIQQDAETENRKRLLDDWFDLKSVCYDDYLRNENQIRITDQDAWIPLLGRIRESINQFNDREDLLESINEWNRAYDNYRKWLRNNTRITQLELYRMWLLIDEGGE